MTKLISLSRATPAARALVVFAALTATPALAQKRAFTLEDVYRTQAVSEIQASPRLDRAGIDITHSSGGGPLEHGTGLLACTFTARTP